MANCSSIFRNYNTKIKLSDKDREILKKARNSLRDRMHKAYQKFTEREKKTHFIEFQSQGSFVMDTIIKPIKDDFDLDDGVYFIGDLSEEKRADTQTFHDVIIKAIDENNEIENIFDKPTCVRVKYVSKYEERDLGFHIDLPIYYAETHEQPELAHTKEGWIESNPVEFIAWFEDKAKSNFNKAFLYESKKYFSDYETWLSDIRKKDTQLRRIVRYLKSWADLKRSEMPPGIVMSILAANNFVENERDDMAFKDTLVAIKKDLDDNFFTCFRPTPKMGENLFANTSKKDKDYFYNALESFINSANFAVANPNQKEACLKWKKHLGDRFPCHLAKDEIEGSKFYAMPPVKNDNSKSAKK